MKIAGQCVVSIHYTVSSNGMEVDSSRGKDPLTYLHGTGGLIPGLEQALEGSVAGDSMVVDIAPEDAYGPVNEDLIQQVPISAFAGVEKVEPGMQFQATGNNGAVQNIMVVGVEDETVTIDANHPLAGQALHFEVEVASVREATSEELQQQ
ncbi:MAG: peptidylprolyl isomerase [Pseudomonadota bacterium]